MQICKKDYYYVNLDSNFLYIRECDSHTVVKRISRKYLFNSKIDIATASIMDDTIQTELFMECRLLNLKTDDRNLYINEIKNYENI